jgi:L-lysine exporter family protein LysE/ArgO
VFSAAIAGFFLGGSLIFAIGAQNAFILRQGLLRQYVLPLSLFCAASDAVLILAGVAGFGEAIKAAPTLLNLVKWGGAAFLFCYSFLAFRRAFQPSQMAAGEGRGLSLSAALAQCAAFTWLNPHVYLDTVMLVGGISTTFNDQRWWFAAGAVSASFVWFLGLGYGARLLTPVFTRPMAWRVLDTIIGCVMCMLAIKVLTTPL